MKWSPEAEKAIKKVPFFVRKKVSARVEKEAKETGKNRITLAEVRTTQAKYISNMTSEIKGYQINICFGPGGCPNRSNQGDRLLEKIEVHDELMDDVGLERRLQSLGIGSDAGVEEMIVSGFNSERAKNNPRLMTKGVLRQMVVEIS